MLTHDLDFYNYLIEEIFPQMSPPPYGNIKIKDFPYHKNVFLIWEDSKNIKVIAKFLKKENISETEAWKKAEKEYYNLKTAHEIMHRGDDKYEIAAPLGKNKELLCLLAMQKSPGKTLDYYIAKAVSDHSTEILFKKLTHLAKFFVKLHQNSQSEIIISFDYSRLYFGKLLKQLEKATLYKSNKILEKVDEYAQKWLTRESSYGIQLFQDNKVIIHGDATPTNFLFYKDLVYGIDMERMKADDRCLDLGFIASELKHHFMWRMGDGFAAEPFIGHFLWEYAINLRGADFFKLITRKIPFFMALGLLRIARNPWLDGQHRINLIGEAKRCLKYAP